MADVEVEVEARVVHPDGVLEARDPVELLAVARHQVQARLDVRREVLVRRRRPVEDHEQVRGELILLVADPPLPLALCLEHAAGRTVLLTGKVGIRQAEQPVGGTG